MNVVTLGLAVTDIRSTGEHVPATIIGRSTRGEDFIHLKYMRNEHEIEKLAEICLHIVFLCPVATIVLRVRYGQVFGTCFLLVAPPCLSTRTQSDRHFRDLVGACARGGGGGVTGGTRAPQHTELGGTLQLLVQQLADLSLHITQ